MKTPISTFVFIILFLYYQILDISKYFSGGFFLLLSGNIYTYKKKKKNSPKAIKQNLVPEI